MRFRKVPVVVASPAEEILQDTKPRRLREFFKRALHRASNSEAGIEKKNETLPPESDKDRGVLSCVVVTAEVPEKIVGNGGPTFEKLARAAEKPEKRSDTEDSSGNEDDNEEDADSNVAMIRAVDRKHEGEDDQSSGYRTSDGVDSVESSFHGDPVDEFVRDLNNVGSNFTRRVASIYNNTLSIFQVAANDVKSEQEFHNSADKSKTLAESMEDFFSGTLINCTSCDTQNEVRAPTVEHINKLVLPTILEEENVATEKLTETKVEKAIVCTSKPCVLPIFYLPKTPTKTYEWEAKREAFDLTGETDGSSSVGSIGDGPENADLQTEAVVVYVASIVSGGGNEDSDIFQPNKESDIVHPVVAPASSFMSGVLSAFSQTKGNETVSDTNVTEISRERSQLLNHDPVSRLRSDIDDNTCFDDNETVDVYRQRVMNQVEGKDLIPPPFYTRVESGEEKRDCSPPEPELIFVPSSIALPSMTPEYAVEPEKQKPVNINNVETQALQSSREEAEENPSKSDWGPTAVEV